VKGAVAFVFFVGALLGTVTTNDQVFQLTEFDEECRSSASDKDHELTRFEITDLKLQVSLLLNSTVQIAYSGEKNAQLERSEQNLLKLQTDLDKASLNLKRLNMRHEKNCSAATLLRADVMRYQKFLDIWIALTGFFAALWLGQARTVEATANAKSTRKSAAKMTKDTKK
jgi:hypothetical protein